MAPKLITTNLVGTFESPFKFRKDREVVVVARVRTTQPPHDVAQTEQWVTKQTARIVAGFVAEGAQGNELMEQIAELVAEDPTLLEAMDEAMAEADI